MYTDPSPGSAPYGADVIAFVDKHRPLLEGIGLTSMQAAVWLHKQGFDGPSVNEDLNMPIEGLFESIQR